MAGKRAEADRAVVSVALSRELLEALDHYCEDEDEGRSRVIRRLLAEMLAKRGYLQRGKR